jgi:murein DD-endopeptidase MepM/ murein hydrolase activator NlpD
MVEYSDSFFYKIRLIAVCILIFGSLLILPLIFSLFLKNPVVHAAGTNSSTEVDSNLEDSPNIITSGMFQAADSFEKTTNTVGKTINNSVNTVTGTIATATTQSGKLVFNTGKFAVNGIGNGAGLMASGVSASFTFTVHTAGNVVGFIGDVPPVSTIIKPADNEHVPVIKNGAKIASTPAAAPIQASNQAAVAPQKDSTAQWPIHGEITTEFGVPHRPYQAYHTGIDISDGRRSGVTPIHPYRPGRVIQVIHSNVSLGNHVVVDNGNGITSVYGHMYSTNVQVGQQVDKNSVLGLEGSTGASTGPHVHFEIYLNGKLQNPHNFVPGHP